MKLSNIYYFEDCHFAQINSISFFHGYKKWNLVGGYYREYNSIGTPCVNLPVKVIDDSYNNKRFSPKLFVDHKGLLGEGKKVWVHPRCKIARSLLAEKYKKCLDPWTADVVVVPEVKRGDWFLRKEALFYNEQKNILLSTQVYYDKIEKFFDTVKEGETLRNLFAGKERVHSYGENTTIFTDDAVLDAELIYYGDMIYVYNTGSHIADGLTRSIPLDKTGCEKSVQESLSSEENRITFEGICSIKDMVDSSDSDTVGAGLKALAMMDWINYPNSVKFMLNCCDWNYRYNKAADSTAVRYMFITLTEKTNRHRWPGGYTDKISIDDYELFSKLKMYYDKTPEDKLLNSMVSYNFMIVSPEGLVRPNIKP